MSRYPDNFNDAACDRAFGGSADTGACEDFADILKQVMALSPAELRLQYPSITTKLADLADYYEGDSAELVDCMDTEYFPEDTVWMRLASIYESSDHIPFEDRSLSYIETDKDYKAHMDKYKDAVVSVPVREVA